MACKITFSSLAKVSAVVMCLNLPLTAQIKKVNFQLKFNPQTSLYDCYMHVAEGNAFTKRKGFNSMRRFPLCCQQKLK